MAVRKSRIADSGGAMNTTEEATRFLKLLDPNRSIGVPRVRNDVDEVDANP